MNPYVLLDLLPYLEALTADTLEENLRLQPEAMEELLASLEPDDPADCWQFSIEPLLHLREEFGIPTMADALVRMGDGIYDLSTLIYLLRHDAKVYKYALYQSQMLWLIAAQLNALLEGGPFTVPDAIEGGLA